MTTDKNATDKMQHDLTPFNISEDPADENLEGFEDINASTMAVPWLKIAQKNSDELDKDHPSYIENLKQGEYFNSVSNFIFGPEVKFICLGFQHRWVEWKPNRGGFVRDYLNSEIEFNATIDKSEFGNFKTLEGNDIQENFNYIGFVVGFESEGPIILSLSRSNIKKAKKWNQQLLRGVIYDKKGNVTRAKPYHFIWKLVAHKEFNEKGSWFTSLITKQGYLSSQEQYDMVLSERKNVLNYKPDYNQNILPESNNSELESQI